MKWVLLFVTATSAVTVFNGEDNVAMESQGGQSQDSIGQTVTVHQAEPRRSISGRHREEKKQGQSQEEGEGDDQASRPPAYFASIQGDGGQTLGYSSYVHHSDEVDAIKQGSSVDLQKVIPKSTVHVEMYHDPQHLEQQPDHQEQQQNHQKLLQNYHQQQLNNQQILQKEAAHAKLKNKPPKFYQEALNSYKKERSNTKAVPEAPLVIKASPSPTHSTPTINSLIKPFPKRSPFKGGRPDSENIPPTKETYSPSNYKAQGHRGSHSTSQSSISGDHAVVHVNSGKRQPHLQNTRSPWKSLSDNVEIAGSEEVKLKPKHSRRTKEVDSEHMSSQKKYFVKDDSSGNQYLGTIKLRPESFGDERFKAERFDHEKALKGSTSFNIENAVSFNNIFEGSLKPEEPSFSIGGSEDFGGSGNLVSPGGLGSFGNSESLAGSGGLGSFASSGSLGSSGSLSSTGLKSSNNLGHSEGFGNSAGFGNSESLGDFHMPSSEELKALDFKSIGSSRAPVQFTSQQQNPQKKPSFSFHGELPIMTEEEFEKAFGKIPKKEIKKPEFKRNKPINRVPFDYRTLPKSQFSHTPQSPQISHSHQISQSPQHSHSHQFSQSPQIPHHIPQLSHLPQISHSSNHITHHPQTSYSSPGSHLAQLSHSQQRQQHPQFTRSPQLSHNQQISLVPQSIYSPKSQQSLSFSQFGGTGIPEWAIGKHGNVDVASSHKFPMLSRKTSAQGRVLSGNEPAGDPQQFSVSASYQIDRNHQI